MTDPSPDARMTVILITPDEISTLKRTLAALRRQTIAAELEILVLCPSKDRLGLEGNEGEGFAGFRVVQTDRIGSTAAARAVGIREARCDIVVFGEDHCFPDPGWAEALVERHRGPWTGVGPGIGNANPYTRTSWANLLIEYSEWLDPVPGGETGHVPGHNSSYKRSPLLEYGDSLAEMLEAESIMQWDLGRRGHRFYVEPRARTLHENYSKFGPSFGLRFLSGRLFAGSRRAEWPLSKRILYGAASPLIPLVRLIRIGRFSARSQRFGRFLYALPCLLPLLFSDGVGEFVGYLAGPGDANRKLKELEFHRHRFMREEETDPDAA